MNNLLSMEQRASIRAKAAEVYASDAARFKEAGAVLSETDGGGWRQAPHPSHLGPYPSRPSPHRS